jgi:2-polyprenyl-6-methoxyphenol hydroxylase-like FAD-dependent oxidoreductase
LLGDAAHPMYPVGANGASQAIVDARVLAYEPSAPDGVRAGPLRGGASRRAATADVVRANRAMQRDGGRGPRELARITDTFRRATGSEAETLNTRPSLTRH